MFPGKIVEQHSKMYLGQESFRERYKHWSFIDNFACVILLNYIFRFWDRVFSFNLGKSSWQSYLEGLLICCSGFQSSSADGDCFVIYSLCSNSILNSFCISYRCGRSQIPSFVKPDFYTWGSLSVDVHLQQQDLDMSNPQWVQNLPVSLEALS